MVNIQKRSLPIFKMVFILSCFILLFQCKSSDEFCEVIDEELGLIKFREESFSAFPTNFFERNQLVFIDSIGNEKIFIGNFEYKIENRFFSTYCFDEINHEIKHLYEYERYLGIFESIDSFRIILSYEIRSEDCLKYTNDDNETVDKLHLTYRDPNDLKGTVGLQKIIRNSSERDIHPNCEERFRVKNEIPLGGETFFDLITSNSSAAPTSNIYFKFGEGIAGFKEHSGKTWKRK